jgi:hypothetical protein
MRLAREAEAVAEGLEDAGVPFQWIRIQVRMRDRVTEQRPEIVVSVPRGPANRAIRRAIVRRFGEPTTVGSISDGFTGSRWNVGEVHVYFAHWLRYRMVPAEETLDV